MRCIRRPRAKHRYASKPLMPIGFVCRSEETRGRIGGSLPPELANSRHSLKSRAQAGRLPCDVAEAAVWLAPASAEQHCRARQAHERSR